MRQGQQNRRGRGRGGSNNNNAGRKGQNPLTRSFESNGPEMKIRGTPAHIAEKYMSLSRDALSGGDPVLAENYLQHAEHYNRIILTYREQQTQQHGNDGVNGSANGGGRHRNQSNGSPAGAERAGDEQAVQASGFIPVHPDAPQPVIQDDSPREQSSGRNPRSSRQDGQRSTRGRNTGGQRSSSSRPNGQKVAAAEGGEPQTKAERPVRQREPRRARNRFGDSDEQPQFLRRPVRRSRTTQPASDPPEQGSTAVKQEATQPQPAGDEPQE